VRGSILHRFIRKRIFGSPAKSLAITTSTFLLRQMIDAPSFSDGAFGSAHRILNDLVLNF